MKHLYLSLTFTLTTIFGMAQVGIGTTNPDSSAILDIQSDSLGMLIPRLSTTARLNIANPANGLLVYDNETESFWGYAENDWQEFNPEIKNEPTLNVITSEVQELTNSKYGNNHYFETPFDTSPILINTVDVSITESGAIWTRLSAIPSGNKFSFITSSMAEQINFFALEPGLHNISDKQVMAGKMDNVNGSDVIEFQEEFESDPIILVSGEVPVSGGTWMRITDVDVAEFEIFTSGPMNVHWVAMESGEYDHNGWQWYAGESTPLAGNFHVINFPPEFETQNQIPIILLSMHEYNNNGPSWARIYNSSETEFEVQFSLPGLEKVHWIAFIKK